MFCGIDIGYISSFFQKHVDFGNDHTVQPVMEEIQQTSWDL